MGAIGFAFLKPRIPGFHIGKVRPVDLEIEIAIELRARRNVAESQCISRDECTAAEMAVEQAEQDGRARYALADQRPIPLLFRRAIEVPEDATEERGLQLAKRP